MYCIVVLSQDQGKRQNPVNMEEDPVAKELAFPIPRLKGPMFKEPMFWVPWIKNLVPLRTTTLCSENQKPTSQESLVEVPPQHLSHVLGTTSGGTTTTSWKNQVKKLFLNVHAIKDKP